MKDVIHTANDQWAGLIADVLLAGDKVPCDNVRGKFTKELLAYQCQFDMKYPVVTNSVRKLSYKFAAAEALWIIRGMNSVRFLEPFSKMIHKFSDDGVTLYGAYGPKVMSQIDNVIDALERDQTTRQAVINIWRENPPKSRDIPCTVNVQWLVRDGLLYCIDNMRSSDAWMGWPYDVFSFSCISMFIALELRSRGVKVELGTLALNAGSQHLYEKDWDPAEKAIKVGMDETPVDVPAFKTELFEATSCLAFELESACDLRHDHCSWLGVLKK
jgi:thymidylate synthase